MNNVLSIYNNKWTLNLLKTKTNAWPKSENPLLASIQNLLIMELFLYLLILNLSLLLALLLYKLLKVISFYITWLLIIILSEITSKTIWLSLQKTILTLPSTSNPGERDLQSSSQNIVSTTQLPTSSQSLMIWNLNLKLWFVFKKRKFLLKFKIRVWIFKLL